MAQKSQPNDKETAVVNLPRRATNVVLAATLAASMVPSAAFAAFEDEVNQAAQGQSGASQSQDAADQVDELYAQSAAEEGASSAVQSVAATADDATSSLDHTDLADGEYSLNIKMMNTNKRQVSMSNGAVANEIEDGDGYHSMTLTVKDGVYWLNMTWQPLDRMLGGTHFVGYLANLSYFENYTISPYPKGDTVPAVVLSEYRNADGSPVLDAYNDPTSSAFVGNNVYPKDVQIKISGSAIDDGWQPVHVFVPVMDAIMAGAGDQNAYVQIDWSSLQAVKATVDKAALESAITSAKAVEQGKKTDEAFATLQAAIKTAQDVYDNDSVSQDDVNNTVTALNAAVKTFQDSADESSSDPYEGMLEQGARYKTAQLLYNADGSDFKASDGEPNVLNGFWTTFETADNADGKYAVTIEDPYNTATPATDPVADSVTYVAPDGSAKQAVKVCDRQKGSENSRQTEWVVYTDNLNEKIQLNLSYTVDGQEKTQTVYLQPAKEGATLVTSFLAALQGNGYMKSLDTDYSPLYLAIQDAKAVGQGKKTAEAYAALQQAITDAQTVLDSNNKKQPSVNTATETLKTAVETFNDSADYVDPFEGKIVQGEMYQRDAEFVDASGNKLSSNPLSGTDCLSTFGLSTDGDSKYYVTFRNNYNTQSNLRDKYPQVTAIEYKVGNVSQSAVLTCDRSVGNNIHYGLWKLGLDDLTQQVELTVHYTTSSGEQKSDVIYCTPLKADAKFGTYLNVVLDKAVWCVAAKGTKVDYAPLYAEIQSAKALQQGDHSDEKWNALQDAITAAQTVLDTDTTDGNTQEKLDAAVLDLQAAVDTFNKKEIVNSYNLEVGKWYGVYGGYTAKSDMSSKGLFSMSDYRFTEDGTYDLNVWFLATEKPTTVKYSTENDLSKAETAWMSSAMTARLNVPELSKLYMWVTYTDSEGTLHENAPFTVDYKYLSKGNFSLRDNQLDQGYLYAALQTAKAIEYGEKSDEAWTALQNAIAAATKVQKTSSSEKSQAEVDKATADLNAAMETYNAAPSATSRTYGLEVGKQYSNLYEELVDASGAAAPVGAESPFYVYGPLYSLQQDGTFSMEVDTHDNVGSNANEEVKSCLVSAIKWNTSDDESTAKDAVKVGGYVGNYTPGTGKWMLEGVSDPAQLYYWVTYTDGNGVKHENEKYSAKLTKLSSSDHGFFEQSTTYTTDDTKLYAALKKAEAVQKDEGKTDLAWTTFELMRETNYIYYVNEALARPQTEVDEHTKIVEDGIALYLSSQTNKADFSALNSSIAEAKKAQADASTMQDKAAALLQGQIDAAQKIADDGNCGQEAVDSAKQELDAVLDSYKASATKASVKSLSDALAEASKLKDAGKGTAESLEALGTAITAAQGVYDKATGFAGDQILGTDAEVNEAATALNAVIATFKETNAVHKEDLNNAIVSAKAIEQGRKSNEAFQNLQTAIAAAQKVADDSEASQDAVDGAVSALQEAVNVFNATPDVSDALDFANLADGVYTVNVDMYKMDRASKSMSDQAINHEVELTVKNGEYYLIFDFQGLKYLGQFGYLGWLKYYDQGYTYSEYGYPQGATVDATVLTTQKNADGSDVYDTFNTVGSADKLFDGLYPDKVQIKYVPQARSDADGYVPLQVFVPVMEALSAGSGTQDVLAKVDKASLKKKEAAAVDATELQAAIASAENELATSKKGDAADAKLRVAVDAASDVLSKDGLTQEEVDAALAELQKAVDEFDKAPDQVVVDKSKLAAAIVDAKALTQGNKTDDAWSTLQAAIAKAEGTRDNDKAMQADVDNALAALNNAVNTFNASADKPAESTLDFSNLPAGTYSINIDMYKMNRADKSMSDVAINHKAKLTVDADGTYWLTLDFGSVKSGTTNGYLGSLSYYDDGYTYSGAKVNGTLVAGNVVDYQTGVDGNQYPNHVTVKFVKQAREDSDHFIPLQVFVPVMEEIAADCGTQDVLAKYDPSTVQKLDGEIPDQTEPGVNGAGTTTTTNPATVSGPSAATKAAATAAKTASGSTSSLAKTGDDSANGLLATAFAGMTAAAVAAYAAMRRRFGKQESEE